MIDANATIGAGSADLVVKRTAACVMLLGILSGPVPGYADVAEAETTIGEYTRPLSLNDIALELVNPVTGLRSFTWDAEYFSHQGDLPGSEDQNGSRWIFTPSWPIRLENGNNILLRLTVPINGDLPNWKPEPYLDYRDFIIRKVPETEPRIDPENGGEFGYGHDHLGDIGLDIGYGGVSEGGTIGMIGLAAVFPTSEDGSGTRNQWLIGPEFALGKKSERSVYGFRLKHLVDIDGEGEQELGRLPTNETTLSLFFARSLGNGWQVESNPVILHDWDAVEGNEWLVPIGAGVSKAFRVGRRPMKLGVELQYYVVSPDRFGPEWLLKFNFIPFLSKSLLE